MHNVTEAETDHLCRLLKQKFISPYKIIYLIDQKEADYFKSRNQNFGCCTASQITISKTEQTKLQRMLHQLITFSAIKSMINQLFTYCEQRYCSVVNKGKQDSLQITNDVQKYLVDNILSESINKFIHTKLVTKLSQQSKSLATDIGLWATPATWNAKYPKIRLQLFDPTQIGELFKKEYTILANKFNSIKKETLQQLLLLQKDGKFEEILWNKNETEDSKTSNEVKLLANPMKYGSLQSDGSYFKYLIKMCVLLQGIPFQLNMKANTYLTICDTLQVYYYNCSPFQKTRKVISSKYEIVVPIGVDLNICVNNEQKKLMNADILIISQGLSYDYDCNQQGVKDAFVIRCCINEAKRIK